MSDTEIDLRAWVENWWRQTGNPTYAWEAISRSLNSGEAIPDWAAEYLKEAADKIRLLGMGRDFRHEDLPRIEPDQAAALVGEALGLWRERAKSAFAKRAEDIKAAHAKLDEEFYGRSRSRDALKRKLHVDGDRVGRIVARGKKLNKPHRP